MQPNGLSTSGGCNLVWSPAGTTLQPNAAAAMAAIYGQPLTPMVTTALSPSLACVTPDATSVNTWASIAAALQQQHASGLLISSPTPMSPSLQSSSAGGVLFPSSAHPITAGARLTASMTNGDYATHSTELTAVEPDHQKHFVTAASAIHAAAVAAANVMHFPGLGAPTNASGALSSLMPPISTAIAPTTVTSSAAAAAASYTSFDRGAWNSAATVGSRLAVATASSLPYSASSPVVRAGMKREAGCNGGGGGGGLSEGVDARGVGLDLHSWHSSKRANLNGSHNHEVQSDNTNDCQNVLYNGTTNSYRETEEQDIKPSIPNPCEHSISPSAYPTYSPSYCNVTTTHNNTNNVTVPGVSNLLNPVNIYNLPYPTSSAVPSGYMSAQHLIYPSLYHHSPPIADPTANMNLNNWLTQQHQVQSTHPFLQAHLPMAHSPTQTHQSPSVAAAVATLAALQQQRQHPEMAPNAQTPSLTLQQQATLYSLLRAQQSQQLVATQHQLAAMMQAGGVPPTGLLHPGSPRTPSIVESQYSIPGALAGLSGSAYAPAAIHCIQNPLTNVAYVNDKGQLLETLPVCRDFKAGKCHRNAECRYVHLVDENVEVNQGRVIVCRDAAKGRCTRVPCKYYHIPLLAISANRSLALNSALASVTPTNNPVTQSL